jgi:phosphate transport system substrate-binding protein
MHKKQDKPAQAQEVLKFLAWAYKEGDKTALDMDYVPMPEDVKAVIRAAWKQIN